MRRAAPLTLGVALALCAGCSETPTAPIGEHTSLVALVPVGTPTEVDLLLMVDNSNDMGEEQALLAMQVPSRHRRTVSGPGNC